MRQPTRRCGLPGLLVLALLAVPGTAPAQVAAPRIAREAVDLDVVAAIREEGLEHSRIPEQIQYLTEVIGPRVTGSPQMRQANEWTAEQLRALGLTNVVIEPWGDFGRGWEREYYAGQVVTPYAMPLVAQPVAWTGSTRGKVRGRAIALQADSLPDLEKYRGRLKGAVVLMQPPPPGIGPEMEWRERRSDADELLAPAEDRYGGRYSPEEIQRMREQRRRERALRAAAAALAKEEGALVLLYPSPRTFANLHAMGGDRDGRDPTGPIPLPQLVVAAEQYDQVWRNVRNGVPVELEFEIRNRFFDDDTKAYNTLGDWPGTDLADQFVMIGGHLDSWHMGTGAVDNAAGVVVMMEAIRILKALDLQPRRTIRIGLWSGEEQGLLGSRGWVANHPEMYPKISAYLNYDNGTGRIRGIWDQSNGAAIPIFEQILWPFRDLGVVAVRHGDTGGTDHLAFDAVGVPGFNFIQDPLEYMYRNHHTHLDTYDHLMLDDLKQSAVVVAATLWELANRDEMMPRKPAPETASGNGS